MVRRPTDDTEHEIVGHADAVRTGDLGEHPVNSHIESHHMAEQTIGLVPLIDRDLSSDGPCCAGHSVMPKRSRP